MATISGASIAISDVLIPQEKNDIINDAQKDVDIKNKFDRHILTDGERYNKVLIYAPIQQTRWPQP